MRETLELGSSPCGEDCAQLGSDGFRERARKECGAYKRQLERVIAGMGKPVPEDFYLTVKGFQHDFGTYYEVAAVFESEEGAELAYALESEIPEHWDEQARKELEQ